MKHLDDGILQAWLDGPRSGLSAAERGEIGRHLSSCDACARRLEDLEALSGRVETLLSQPEAADEPVPEYEAVLARARRRRVTGRRRARWTAAAWAASVVAALGVGWAANGIYRSGRVAQVVVDRARLDSSSTARAVSSGKAAPAADGKAGSLVAVKPVPDTTSPASAADAEGLSPGAPVAGSGQAAPVVARLKTAPDTVSAARVAPAAALDVVATNRSRMPRSDTAPALVRGLVTDESGHPLSAAEVFVEGTGVGAVTRSDGSFELSLGHASADSTLREVTLKARMIGYEDASRSLAMRGGEVVSTSIRLVPKALALQELVVTGTGKAEARRAAGQPEIVVPADDVGWGSWRTTGRDAAEAEAGFRLLTVPDLRVVRIEVGSASGAALVRVVQELDGGGSLDLIEARSTLRFGGSAVSTDRAHATVRRADVSVAASAPLGAEALAALLRCLK